MHLSLMVIMIYRLWCLTVQFIPSMQQPVVSAPGFSQVGASVPTIVDLASLSTTLATMSAAPWMNPIAHPNGVLILFDMVVHTNTTTNQGYPLFHLAPAYMPISPVFYQRGFAMPQQSVLLPQAQRFPLVYPSEGADSFPSGLLPRILSLPLLP